MAGRPEHGPAVLPNRLVPRLPAEDLLFPAGDVPVAQHLDALGPGAARPEREQQPHAEAAARGRGRVHHLILLAFLDRACPGSISTETGALERHCIDLLSSGSARQGYTPGPPRPGRRDGAPGRYAATIAAERSPERLGLARPAERFPEHGIDEPKRSQRPPAVRSRPVPDVLEKIGVHDRLAGSGASVHLPTPVDFRECFFDGFVAAHRLDSPRRSRRSSTSIASPSPTAARRPASRRRRAFFGERMR